MNILTQSGLGIFGDLPDLPSGPGIPEGFEAKYGHFGGTMLMATRDGVPPLVFFRGRWILLAGFDPAVSADWAVN
jgi:hypothetical protein